MRTSPVVVFAVLGAFACSEVASSGPEPLARLLERANQANVQHDVAAEERLLREAVARSGPARERAQARRELARTRWKFHHDFSEAAALLGEAVALGAEPARAWAERSRMERSRRDLRAAVEAARRGIASARNPFEQRLAVLALSLAVIDAAVESRLQGGPDDDALLEEAFEHQRELTRAQPGDHDAARAMLTLAVLLDRSDGAVEAWKAYYFVTEREPGPGLVVEAGRRMAELYSDWGPAAAPEQRIALADALEGSRFFLEGALVALDPAGRGRAEVLRHRRMTEIVAYARFCRQIREFSEEFYRLTSLGEGDDSHWREQLAAAAAELWQVLDGPRSGPPSSQGSSLNGAIRGELASRFGAYGSLRRSGGFPSLHYGHVTERETRTVEQYGHIGTLTHTVLDHMVSNGFQSWAWNSTMEAGGWATSRGMVSVRSGLLREVVDIWNTYDSPVRRAVIEDRIERETPLDDERARQSVVHLPGLYSRIARQAIEGVVGRLREQGVGDTELRLAAITELRRLQQESAIFAHEGRHAIDLARDASQRSAELEFTAKLSQVAFSPVPRLGLFGILGPNLGDATPHGQANLKFAQKAIEWMRAHEAEIEGFDPARPHLPQLDLLSEDQLVEMVRWMDPLAR